MAEYEERSLEDLTEEPSPFRLEEMRRKGQVAQSRELTASVIFFGVLGISYYSSSFFVKNITEFMKQIFSVKLSKSTDFIDFRGALELLHEFFKISALTLTPIFLGILILGITTSVAQMGGFIFSIEPLQLNFSKVDPVNGFRRIFSFKGVFEGLKSIVKFIFVSLIVYYLLKNEFYKVADLIGMAPIQILTYISLLAVKVCAMVGLLMLVISGFDFFVQWLEFRKRARLTKSEAKQELKEREGDPQLKARIRSIQREMARKRMLKSVPKADVIVTNPTHIAVALIYEKDMLAPKVVAKGADFLAEKIRNIAREHGIPMVENKPLARALYKTVKVGQMVPRSMYQAIAEVLAFVYKIKPKDIFTHQ